MYEPPDVPGLFEKHVWPMYLHYKELTERSVAGVRYLDGTQELSKNVDLVRKEVAELLDGNADA